jgi:2'-5' RNA ligase
MSDNKGIFMRCFLAVDVSEKIKQQIAVIQKRLYPKRAKVSWVKPQHVHLTLHFFGELFEDEINKAISVLSAISLADFFPLCLSLDILGAFPTVANPRVVWIGLKGDVKPLCSLQACIVTSLREVAFPVENRRYTPHITLGRVKRFNSDKELCSMMGMVRIPSGNDFQVNEFKLMASTLTPKGPHYTVLQSFS